MLRSTSACVVDQLLMLTRMARRPCHVVGPHQQVPSPDPGTAERG
jgi:hypothetical protein